MRVCRTKHKQQAHGESVPISITKHTHNHAGDLPRDQLPERLLVKNSHVVFNR